MRKLVLSLCVLGACGGGGEPSAPDAHVAPKCETPPGPFAVGDLTGSTAPLASDATHASAGRVTAQMLADAAAPPFVTWAPGDFVLANDRVAMVIEDVGPSDLYDPWGGRPVGLARVAGGKMVSPANFGEDFFLTERSTIVTAHVSVLHDGSDGGPAVVRASGKMAPLPFLDNLLSSLYFDDLTDLDAAIDYSLAPGSEVVEVTMHFGSPRATAIDSGPVLHGFMYTPRMPPETSARGFDDYINGAPWVKFVDDGATSWAYQAADGPMNSSISESGFLGAFSTSFTIAPCGVTDHPHARLLIAGPGLDGLEAARARVDGESQRAIHGTTSPGARVHATAADGSYVSRVTADDAGAYTIHVPAAQAVTLTAYQRGHATATADVPVDVDTADLVLPASGFVHVTAHDASGPLPARVQLIPAGASTIPTVPSSFGEPMPTDGRLDVQYPIDGDITLAAPPGPWRVVVSRGYEYDLHDETVDVTAGDTTQVDATLTRVVDTTGVQCGDFHIHTHRSNDSGDDATEKVRSAVADGLEIPVRSDHEWVASFQPIIEQLGVTPWAFGIGSIEMTSFQIWGHMGVFPLTPDPSKPNAGAPLWQTWPTVDAPDVKVKTLEPPDVFAQVRARPEHPTIIINHPMGSSDYFTYAGLDANTGLVAHPERWDSEFKLVEVFNSADWIADRDRTVAAWFSMLKTGRTVFAVGSSDSHGIRSSPVGYPRTCIQLGTDDPRQLTADGVRDALVAGHATISGGIYVDAHVGAAGPGDTATVGATATVHVKVQAAPWIAADAIDVVVDGATVQTIPIPASTDVVRYEADVQVPVAAAGSFVVIAAYAAAPLEPVHPGRIPFGVTNPIFLHH